MRTFIKKRKKERRCLPVYEYQKRHSKTEDSDRNTGL